MPLTGKPVHCSDKAHSADLETEKQNGQSTIETKICINFSSYTVFTLNERKGSLMSTSKLVGLEVEQLVVEKNYYVKCFIVRHVKYISATKFAI